MKIISLNYRNADYNLRAKFAARYNDSNQFYENLLSNMPEIDGAVVISTCNRFELVYSEKKNVSIRKTLRVLCGFLGLENVSPVEIFNLYEGAMAIKHLLRVVSGIDSMVLGEDEIFRQTKESYLKSLESGYTGKELNIIFQKCFEASKEVKTRTGISKVPVSIGTLVTNVICDRFADRRLKVMVLGASGKMGGIVIRNLIAKGNVEIFGCVRKHSSGDDRYWNTYPDEMKKIDYSDRYNYLDEMDVVVSATTSPHYVITYEKASKAFSAEKDRLFIDLAVPADIDEELNDVQGISLMRIDDFNEISRNYNEKKKILAKNVDAELEQWVEEIESEVEINRLLGMSMEISRKINENGLNRLLISARNELSSEELRSVTKWFNRFLGENEA